MNKSAFIIVNLFLICYIYCSTQLLAIAPVFIGSSLLSSHSVGIEANIPLSNVSATCNLTDPSHACSGANISLTASANGTISGYQWQILINAVWQNLSLSQFPTSTQSTLIIPNAIPANSGQYRCIVYGCSTCNPAQVATNAINIFVWNPYLIIRNPTTNIVCQSQNLVYLTVLGNGATYSYQWQKDGIDIPISTNQTANTNQLSLSTADFGNSGMYKCRLNIEDCRGIINIYSDSALLFIESKTKITQQPQPANVSPGGTASFEVQTQVIGTSSQYPNNSASIQWYSIKNGIITMMIDNERISGSQSSIMSIDNVQLSDYDYFYYAVINGLCGKDSTVQVNIWQSTGVSILSVNYNPYYCATHSGQISINAVPTGKGKNLTYQWLFQGNKINDGNKYIGSTTNTLTIDNIALSDSGFYSCKVTADGVVSVQSQPFSINILSPPVITQQPNANVNIKAGKTLTLNLSATGSDTLQYEWFLNGTSLQGRTFPYPTTVIDSITTQYGGTYYCVVSNECGSDTSQNEVVSLTYFEMLGVYNNTLSNGFQYALFPNPVYDAANLIVKSNKQRTIAVRLYDALGKQVSVLFNGLINENVNIIQIDVNALKLVSGVYIYSISDDNGFYCVDKMIVSK